MKAPLVVLAGGVEGEAWLCQKALRRLVGPERLVVLEEARAARWNLQRMSGFEEAVQKAGIFVLLSPFPDRMARAHDVLYEKRHLALGPPFTRSAEDGRMLSRLARAKGVVLAALEPMLAQNSMAKLLEIVDRDHLGRLSSIRQRSVLAGRGGWDASFTPDFRSGEACSPVSMPDLLFREVFEKVAIGTRLVGPLAEVVHQGCIESEAAGSTMVAWKHLAVKAYGLLEIVRSPALCIRSPYDAREDTVEITGSAGVAWASCGMGRMRNEPAVRFYLQEDLLCYERIEEDFLYGVTATLRRFLEQVERRRSDDATLKRAIDAVAVAEIVARAEADGRRWPTGHHA